VNVLYATSLVIATLIWGFIFYKKDYHPQPFRVIAQIFVIGLCSMVPLFGYHYVYNHFLPALAEYEIFEPLFDSFILKGLIFFGINIAILAGLIFILSGVLTLVLTFFRHETLENIKKSLKEDELCFVAVSVIIGLLIYFESFFEKIFSMPIVNSILGAILILSVIEEYIKHLIVRFTDDKKLKDIDDAMTLSIMVGLSFALMESLIYGVTNGDMSIIVPRAILSMPVHIVASGIFGYFYGLSHFAKPLTENAGKEKTYSFKWLHRILTFKRSTVYEDEKIIEGLCLASIFHATCNLLFEIDLAFAAVPIIVIGLFIVFHLYKESHVIYYRLRHAH
jgi:RsiW-degrading membrane proteinase PrsW (M82 family)